MVYALTQTLALFFLMFVLVAQAFKKVPALTALAPTQSELPFAAAEFVLLAIFLALAVAAAMRFRPIVVGEGVSEGSRQVARNFCGPFRMPMAGGAAGLADRGSEAKAPTRARSSL